MTLTADTIRALERDSIRAFMESCSDLYVGRVLDFGAGRQPFKTLIESTGADYHPFDRGSHPANVSGRDDGPDDPLTEDWDVIVCNQVLQYVPDVPELLAYFSAALYPGGTLILTGATTWVENEREDLHRHTLSGIAAFLDQAGFDVERLESRASIDLPGFALSLGYGAVAVSR